MPTLCWRFNYRNIELYADGDSKASVPVMRRDGDYKCEPWLGFITEDEARRLHQLHRAKPVLLKIYRYSDGVYPLTAWQDVPKDHFVQGCLVNKGVYAVVQPQVKLVSKASGGA